jgi:hypothetical protein
MSVAKSSRKKVVLLAKDPVPAPYLKEMQKKS